MSTFSNRLRSLRQERGLTQDELAKSFGISKSTVSMYENGNREPDFETLEMIADFFNVDMNYLLGNQSEKTTTSVYQPNKTPYLTASEQELLTNFRQLNEEGQELVLKAARSYVRSGDYIKTDESELVEEKEIG